MLYPQRKVLHFIIQSRPTNARLEPRVHRSRSSLHSDAVAPTLNTKISRGRPSRVRVLADRKLSLHLRLTFLVEFLRGSLSILQLVPKSLGGARLCSVRQPIGHCCFIAGCNLFEHS